MPGKSKRKKRGGNTDLLNFTVGDSDTNPQSPSGPSNTGNSSSGGGASTSSQARTNASPFVDSLLAGIPESFHKNFKGYVHRAKTDGVAVTAVHPDGLAGMKSNNVDDVDEKTREVTKLAAEEEMMGALKEARVQVEDQREGGSVEIIFGTEQQDIPKRGFFALVAGSIEEARAKDPEAKDAALEHLSIGADSVVKSGIRTVAVSTKRVGFGPDDSDETQQTTLNTKITEAFRQLTGLTAAGDPYKVVPENGKKTLQSAEIPPLSRVSEDGEVEFYGLVDIATSGEAMEKINSKELKVELPQTLPTESPVARASFVYGGTYHMKLRVRNFRDVKPLAGTDAKETRATYDLATRERNDQQAASGPSSSSSGAGRGGVPRAPVGRSVG